MIFGEWVYGAFLLLAAVAFRVVPARARPWFLAASGLLFYAYYSVAFVWLLLAEIALVYLLTRRVRRSALAYGAALALTIGVLVVYKYGGLLGRSAQEAARAFGTGELPTFPQLFLPLAISFFTFEFVHYIVDARADRLPEHTLGEFLAFALFFPTMVAGPIKRFQGFQPQIASARVSAQNVNDGVTRIVLGLGKKIVIADSLRPLTTPLLSTSGMDAATDAQCLVALLAFSFMIYADFSAYSDIAIGSAQLFGIRVPENFSWPYLRRNIAQFWRHWHMSLTAWITDYVYKPLGGNRKGLGRTAVNSIAAFAVSGLWHGAQWHFLVWGLYHGALLAGYRYWDALVRAPLSARWQLPREGRGSTIVRGVGIAASTAVTFSLVTLGWGLFVMPVERFVELLGRLV